MTGGGVVDPNGVALEPVCDADTGACAASDNGVAPQAGGGVAAVGAVMPTVLDQDSGWSGSIAVMLLVVLLTVGLVLAPALVWRRYSRVATA